MNERLDSLGMWKVTYGLPEQFDTARRAALAVGGIPTEVDAAIVCGMGGSGVAGDVAALIALTHGLRPVIVSKDYELPAFAGPRTLVVAVSFSGNTEETLTVADQARRASCPTIAVTAGGALADRAESWGAPVLPLDAAIPMPRAAIAAVAVPPLVALAAAGVLGDLDPLLDSASRQLHARRDELVADDEPLAALARRTARTIPLIYGGGPVGQVASRRWKNQVNENLKGPAFAHAVPELCHNEICGFGQYGDMTRQVLSLVELRHGLEHPQVGRRFELMAPLLDEVVHERHRVDAKGAGPLAQLFDLVMQGDVWSLHLAALEGVDPGPVPVLDHLKEQLSGRS